MGRRYQTTHPWLHHLHVWRVCGCEPYLIFSHTTDDTLFVQRVFMAPVISSPCSTMKIANRHRPTYAEEKQKHKAAFERFQGHLKQIEVRQGNSRTM